MRFKKLIDASIVKDRGFKRAGSVYFKPPVGDILRGICMESPSRDHFYIWYFLLPLYVPTSHLYFSHGSRMISGRVGLYDEGWDADSDDLLPQLNYAFATQALPYIEGVTSPRTFIARLEAEDDADHWTSTQAIAYSLIRIGEFDQAARQLTKLREQLKPDRHPADHDRAGRAKELLSQLTVDPGLAQVQLEVWKNQTLQNLKLPSNTLRAARI